MATGRRVPSTETIASLEQVPAEDLKGDDKSMLLHLRPINLPWLTTCPVCIICYNEFGVTNPEGVAENAIRLPKCKHIFGAACIKKWFQDSDSCPYCRDKLPSEFQFGAYVDGTYARLHAIPRPAPAGMTAERLVVAQRNYRAAQGRSHMAPVSVVPRADGASASLVARGDGITLRLPTPEELGRYV